MFSPSNASCVNFTMPKPMVKQGIIANCKSMPHMVGCTVEHICTSPDSSPKITLSPHCAGFPILKALCADMPGMLGCKNYTTMCSDVSVVKECHMQALPLPKTMALSKTVETMCTTMHMEPCDRCKKQGMMLQCDLLRVYSDLCKSMWMDGCEEWQQLCDVVPDWPLCVSGGRSGSEEIPTMKMYFHASILDYVLFKEWVPRDGWQYALTIIAVIILGMFYKLLKEGRSIYEGYANHKQKEDAVNYVGEHHSVNHDSGLGETDLTNGHGRLHHGHSSGVVWEILKGWNWRLEIPRASLAFVETAVGLILMLVAMTFNTGLFLAVCAGAFFGSLLFGRFAHSSS